MWKQRLTLKQHLPPPTAVPKWKDGGSWPEVGAQRSPIQKEWVRAEAPVGLVGILHPLPLSSPLLPAFFPSPPSHCLPPSPSTHQAPRERVSSAGSSYQKLETGRFSEGAGTNTVWCLSAFETGG